MKCPDLRRSFLPDRPPFAFLRLAFHRGWRGPEWAKCWLGRGDVKRIGWLGTRNSRGHRPVGFPIGPGGIFDRRGRPDPLERDRSSFYSLTSGGRNAGGLLGRGLLGRERRGFCVLRCSFPRLRSRRIRRVSVPPVVGRLDLGRGARLAHRSGMEYGSTACVRASSRSGITLKGPRPH
jgi:hypothetical protein